MKWTVGLDGGPRRVNHAAVAVEDKIYSFGGYCSGEDYSIPRSIDVHVLNTHNYRWRMVQTDERFPDVPFQRYGHTVVALDSKIYLWGGRSDEYCCNRLYVFDVDTERWSSPEVKGIIPEARDSHSACIIDRCMYICAGYLEYSFSYTQDIQVLDIDQLSWRSLYRIDGTPPSYRDFHTTVPYKGKMYVWGGRQAPNAYYNSPESEEYGNEMYILNVQFCLWELVECFGDIPIGRRSHSSVIYNNKMYIFGGYNSIEKQHYNDCYNFDFETKIWTKVNLLGDGPTPRRRHSCCVVGKKMFFFGGTSPRPGIAEHVGLDDVDEFSENNLLDHDDLHVLDMCPTLRTLALIEVIKHKIDPPWLPNELKLDIKFMTEPNTISRPLTHTG